MSSQNLDDVIGPGIDHETLSEITEWARIQFDHHKDGLYVQETGGLFYKLTASLKPTLHKSHNGKNYKIQSVAFFGNTFILIEKE